MLKKEDSNEFTDISIRRFLHMGSKTKTRAYIEKTVTAAIEGVENATSSQPGFM